MRLTSFYHLALLTLFFLSLRAFAEDPQTANRNAVISQLNNLTDRAQEFYRKPISRGGGGGSFATLRIRDLTETRSNATGSFAVSSPSAASVVLTGTGIVTGNDDSTPVEVVAVVYADSVTMTINN